MDITFNISKDELERRIRSLSDTELLSVIESSEGYTQDAVNIARQEIEKRGGVNKLKHATMTIKMQEKIVTEKKIVKSIDDKIRERKSNIIVLIITITLIVIVIYTLNISKWQDTFFGKIIKPLWFLLLINIFLYVMDRKKKRKR